MKKVISTCIYCGCGCKLTYHVENNKIVKISGFQGDDISEGKPCIKGLTINEVFDKNRIKEPYIRKGKKLVKANWEETISLIYKKVKKTKPKEIFLNGSGKITNEDNFLIYKIGKYLFNTNDIDSCCGRLCHISTVRGITDCFGASNLTKMSNLDKIDTLFIIGSNPAISYPVFWNKVMKRKKQLTIISVQPILNITSKLGGNFLEIEPGTETALLNGIISYIIQKGSFNKNSKKNKNFKKLEKLSKAYTPKYVSKICEIDESDFLKFCKIIASSKKLGVFHGMNFTQHINSLENVHSLLNLSILKNAHLLTLRGEINVQGVGDVFSIDKELKGNIIKSFLLKPYNTKVAFITEFNPAQSLPNLKKVHRNLKKMFIIYLGSYFNLTCDYADVVLPIPALFENEGTITNGEQRIRKVSQVIKTKNPDLLEIAKLLAKKFGKQDYFQYKSYKEIFKEITKKVPEYNKVNPDKVYKNKDEFAEKKIKYKRFFPEPFKGKDDKRTKKYNLLLTTFREMHQFLTSEITAQSKTLTKLDKDKLHVYINPDDAKELNIKDEDKIKIISESGKIKALARISDIPPKGIIATKFHYKDMLVNKLFPPKFDDITSTPNYKCVAVRIKKD